MFTHIYTLNNYITIFPVCLFAQSLPLGQKPCLYLIQTFPYILLIILFLFDNVELGTVWKRFLFIRFPGCIICNGRMVFVWPTPRDTPAEDAATSKSVIPHGPALSLRSASIFPTSSRFFLVSFCPSTWSKDRFFWAWALRTLPRAIRAASSSFWYHDNKDIVK